MSITYAERDDAGYKAWRISQRWADIRRGAESEPVTVCTYLRENGRSPCCTHDCKGCVWYEEQEDYGYDE